MNVISVALQLIIMFRESEELILLSKPLNSSINVGESLSFECSFDKLDQVVAWLTDSKILFVGNTQFNAPNRYLSESFSDKHLNISGSSLTIFNVTSEDDRSYTCSVKGSNISATAELNVLTPPNPPFIGFDGSKVRNEGDVITLNCTSSGGNPAPQLFWKRNGSYVSSARFIPPQNKFSTTSSLLSWKLSSEDHLLDFTCVIPDVGNYASIIFRVNYAPVISVGIHNPLVVVEGSSLTINCSVSSYPSSQIYWKRNNKTEIGSSFFIANISPSDEGSYVCHAKNFIEKQKILKLTVLQVPLVQMTLRRLDEIQGITGIQLEKEIYDEENVQIKEFESIQVICKCDDAKGEENSWWNKDGKHENRGNIMFLQHIKRHQSGIYSCTVSRNLQPSLQPSSHVRASKKFKLSVLYKPGRSSITLPNSIVVGQISVLKCHASDEGYPKAEFVWFRDGFEIFKGGELQLQPLLSDSGIYTCNAFNVVGRGESDSKEIVVNEPPEPLPTDQLKLVTVKAGDLDDIKLKCSVRGNPSPVIKWVKDGRAIEELDRQQIRTTSTLMNGSSFNVTSVFFLRGFEAPMVPFSIMDAGEYLCFAKNNVSEDTIVVSITVDVKFAPKIISKPEQFVKTFENGLVAFDVQSNPAPIIEWINGTKTIKLNSSRFSIKTFAFSSNTYRVILELNPVLSDDIQNYTIIASNECGNDTSVIQVKEAECPDAPYNLTIYSASWDSVEITWVEGYNGGFQQNFVVQMTPIGKNFSDFTYFSHSTRINISGLIPRTSYAIKVYGENEIGRSEMSKEVILPKLRLNSPIKAEYLFKQQTILISLPKNIYANRVETKVEIWQDTCARIDIFNGLSWFTEIPCCKELKIFLGTSKMEAFEIKVFLCLEHRPDICSEGIFAEIDAPVKIISHQVTILIGSLCGTLILIFSMVVIVLCIRKKRSFDQQALINKDRNSEMLGSSESTISHISMASPLPPSSVAINEFSNHERWADSFPFLHVPAYCLQAGDSTRPPSTGLPLYPLTVSPEFINNHAPNRRIVYEVIV